MNDKIILDDYLLLLKSTVEVYVHGTLESSNSSSREILKSALDETMLHQSLTYNEMVNKDYYVINNVKESEVNKVLNKVEKSN